MSSWVRPNLKKYQTFPVALQDFRQFLTDCMADKTLIIQVKK